MATLKNLLMAPLAVVFIVLGTVNAVQAKTFYGKAKALGQGSVRSFVDLDDNGNPLDIGVAFTQGALSLPTDRSYPTTNINVMLPPEASSMPFTYIPMSYFTENYEPPFFDVPNFYFPFFLIGPKERKSICPHPDTSDPVPKCVGDELAQVIETPAPDAIPEGMIHLPPTDLYYGQPEYGTRYVDPDVILPIINGEKPYTTVYEYGFNQGKMDFLAIGVARSFFETQPNFTYPIKLPTSYPKSGYYPTAYSVTYDAASLEYRVTLKGLTYRSVPEPSPKMGFKNTWCLGCSFPSEK